MYVCGRKCITLKLAISKKWPQIIPRGTVPNPQFLLCRKPLLFIYPLIGISAALHSWRERRAAQNESAYQGSGAGTRFTGVSGGGTTPQASASYNSSVAYNTSSAFEPSDDTLPRRKKGTRGNPVDEEPGSLAIDPTEGLSSV